MTLKAHKGRCSRCGHNADDYREIASLALKGIGSPSTNPPKASGQAAEPASEMSTQQWQRYYAEHPEDIPESWRPGAVAEQAPLHQAAEPAPASRAVGESPVDLQLSVEAGRFFIRFPESSNGLAMTQDEALDLANRIHAVFPSVSEPAGAASPDVAKMVEEAKWLARAFAGAYHNNTGHEPSESLEYRCWDEFSAAIDALGAAATQTRALRHGEADSTRAGGEVQS